MKKLIYYIALSVMCLLPASCSLEEEISKLIEKISLKIEEIGD